ncbi:MAG: hypothetical protein RLZZ344_1, partial [Pseudomonadota bacterium]
LGDYKPPVATNVEVELPMAEPLEEGAEGADSGANQDNDSEIADDEEESSAEDDPAAALLREMKAQK